MATKPAVTSLYRIRRTSTGEALLDFNLDYPEDFNLSGQNLTFKNNFQSTELFVRPGVFISLESRSNAAVADKIYLQDSWSAYTGSISLSGDTLTLSRGTGKTQEKVEFQEASKSADKLVFKDGTVTVADVYAKLAPVTGQAPTGQPAITAALNTLTATGTTTSATPRTLPATPATVDIKAILVNPAGENVVSFGPGSKLTVSGSSGIDRVYVQPGSEVYAVNLRGGIDEIYVRGTAAEYRPDLSTPGVLTLTRSVTLGGRTYIESVSVGSSLMNNDLLVFADGAIRTNVAAVALKANASATLANLPSWAPHKATPGLSAQLDLDNVASGNNYSKALNGAETHAGASIAPAADTLVSFSAVQSIKLAMGGAGLDADHDQLLLTGQAGGAADIALALNANAASSAHATIGNIAHLNYSYNASTHTLTITPASGFTLATADVENIVRAIRFQNRETAPNPGPRTFAVSVTNGSGEGAVSTATLTVPSDVSAPVIAHNPALALQDKTGATVTHTANLGVGGKVVLTIDLGEAASGLTGLPSGNSGTSVFTIGNAGAANRGGSWSIDSANNHLLLLTYTLATGDNGNISVDNAALKTALANTKDTAGNFAKIGNAAWADGSFTASTTTHIADTTAPSISGSASFTVTEKNSTTVTTLTASDSVTSSNALVWALAGGTDDALFNLSSTGALSFKTAPTPAITNIFSVKVGVTDAAGNLQTKDITVIGDDGSAPVLGLSGAASSNNVVISNIGNTQPISLSGGSAGSSTAPYLDLPDVLLGNGMTLEARVNFSSLSDGARVFDIGNPSGNDNLILGVKANGRVFSTLSLSGRGVASAESTTAPIVTGQWHHLALVVLGQYQTLYVDGVEVAKAAAPIWFTSDATGNQTRMNTWIGKSFSGADAFANMQIQDVRVYDYARSSTQLASDRAGDAVDTTDPELRLAYLFNGNLKSSIPGQAAATPVNFSRGDAPLAVAPNATLSETTAVRSVQVSVSGILDGASEKLSVHGSSFAADGSETAGTVLVGGSTWAWAYAAGGFTFTAPDGSAPASAAQALLRGLSYSDVAATPSKGDRVITISATDVFGNQSAALTSTLRTGQTSQPDLDSTPGNDTSQINLSLAQAEQGITIAANAQPVSSDSPVSSIKVQIAGSGLDVANDRLVLTGPAAGDSAITLALNTNASSLGDVTMGGIGGLRYSYSYSRPDNSGTVSRLLTITSSTGSIASADVDNIISALQFKTSAAQPSTDTRTFAISVVNAAGEGAPAVASISLLDTVPPTAPILLQGSGVSGGASLAEALAGNGVVTVKAESGSNVVVTFQDYSNPANRVTKTVTGTGAAQPVTLDSGDLGNVAGKLHDGVINVSAVATDAFNNSSTAGVVTLRLDTSAPAPVLSFQSGQSSTLGSADTSVDIEVSSADMAVGEVITLLYNNATLGTATVVPADVSAGKATIRVQTSALGSDGNKSITATVTDLAGNTGTSATALAVSVNKQNPSLITKPGQDAWMNAAEASSGVDLEVRTSLLSVGDTIQLKYNNTSLGSLYTVVAADVTAGLVRFNVTRLALGNSDGSKSITADFTHNGTTTTSAALVLTVDSAAPSGIALAIQSGQNHLISASESGVDVEVRSANLALNDVIRIKNGSTVVGSYTVKQTDVTAGFASVNVAAKDLGADGAKSLSAEVRDAAGNSGSSSATPLSVTLDTQGPLLGLLPGSGADAFINSAEAAAAAGVSVTVTGVSVGDVIRIMEGNTILIGPVTITTAGSYSGSFARSLLSVGDGVKTLSVFATDAAGNTGRANQLDLLVDSTAPAALTVTTSQTLTENTVHVGSVLTLPTGASAWKIGGTDAAFFAMDGNQLRFVTPPDFERPRNAASNASNTNAYSITLTAVDAAGNTAGGVAAQTLTITVADVASEGTTPVLTLQPGRSSSTLAEASSGLGVLSVVGAANATVSVVFSRSGGGTVTKTITQDANGAASNVLLTAADLATLGEGSISVSSSSAAGAGNNLAFTLDSTAPTSVSLAASPASGSLFNTATHTLTLTANFTGLADGDTLTLLENGVALKQTFTVSNAASGTQTLTLDRYWLSSGDGIKTLTLVASDAAGNSSASTALNLTVDTTAAPTLRSNALIGGVDTSINRLQLAVDDAVGSDTSTNNGVSTQPYIHITWLEAGSSWQYSLDSGSTWTTVAAHNAYATDATLALPASSTPYAVGSVQVRQMEASGLAMPVTSNSSMALSIPPGLTSTTAVDDASSPATLRSAPSRYLRITTETNSTVVAQALSWSNLRIWVMQNGMETELPRTGWVFTGNAASASSNNLTDSNTTTAYSTAAQANGTWLQADLGGYYTVSRVQLVNTTGSGGNYASNQTVSLSANDMSAAGLGTAGLITDATVSNFNTGTVAAGGTVNFKPSLATDDSTPTLQGKLASDAALEPGKEYAVYALNLDATPPTPTKLAGNFSSTSLDWGFTPSSPLADGRYAFTLVQQNIGNSSFSNDSVVKSASSMVLNIDNNSPAAAPTLDLNSATTGNHTAIDSSIGTGAALKLTGGARASTTAPYVILPNTSLGNDLTLEAWVNFAGMPTGSRIFDIGNSSIYLNIVDFDGAVSATVVDGINRNTITSTINASTPALVTNTWYHIAYVIAGTTQTVYVNGQEWVKGTLSNGFNTKPSTLTGPVFIGRAPVFERLSFSNMQVKDARVYDDARTADELSSDMAGTPVDVTDPNLRLAYKLQGNSSQSSIPGQANATLANLQDSFKPIPLTPTATLSDASAIASVQVQVSGVLDGSNEKLIVAGTELAANGAQTSGTVQSSNATWNWTYAAASKTFTFNAPGGGVSAGLAQSFLQSLGYMDKSASASMGNRVLGISATDVFGHSSQVATATLQDSTLPAFNNTPAASLSVRRGQATDLADLVFSKGERTDDPSVLTLTALPTNASFTINGLTDADSSTPGFQLVGTAAQLRSNFAPAKITVDASASPSLNLALTDAVGHSVSYSYPLAVDNTIPLGSALNNPANATKALDVTSNLVFTLPDYFAGTLTGVAGKSITITDNGHLGTPAAATGYAGENASHSYTIPVLLADGSLNPLIRISGTGASTTITVNPDANFDLDLSASYSVSIPAGAFVSGSSSSAAISASFSTVTPGTVTEPALSANATASAGSFTGTRAYSMDATGALLAGNQWLSVDGLGNSSNHSVVSLDLVGGDYTVVFRDSAAAATDLANGHTTTGLAATGDLAVLLDQWGLGDRVYVDDQFHDASKRNDLDAVWSGKTGSGSSASVYEIALDSSNRTHGYLQLVLATSTTFSNGHHPIIGG